MLLNFYSLSRTVETKRKSVEVGFFEGVGYFERKFQTQGGVAHQPLLVVWWRELDEVENECTSHNFCLFAISLPNKLSEFDEFLTKTNLRSFLDTVYMQMRQSSMHWKEQSVSSSDYIWPVLHYFRLINHTTENIVPLSVFCFELGLLQILSAIWNTVWWHLWHVLDLSTAFDALDKQILSNLLFSVSKTQLWSSSRS